MEEAFEFTVGIDWGSRDHQVCVVSSRGKIVRSLAVGHQAEGLAKLADLLDVVSRREPGRIGVAIEVPNGPVVETLMERGFSVFHINPKQLDRFRDRHTVAGAKDDRRDAYVLADSLRTDRQLFHAVQIDHPLIIRLRGATRLHEELTVDLGRAASRLREELQRTRPQLVQLSRAADDPWLWDLLALAPTPSEGSALTLEQVTKLLKSRRITKVTAGVLYEALQAPSLRVAAGVSEAAGAHITMLVPQLKLLQSQLRAANRELKRLLRQLNAAAEAGEWGEHRDVAVVLSLPGVGTDLGATMLAEASHPLAERAYHALRTLLGTAPVTYQSGLRRSVRVRRAASPRLKNVAYNWGLQAIRLDSTARAHYDELRARGLGHARCLRGVVDRLLKILVAMLREQTDYDETRRRRFLATAA
jgi:transposase